MVGFIVDTVFQLKKIKYTSLLALAFCFVFKGEQKKCLIMKTSPELKAYPAKYQD